MVLSKLNNLDWQFNDSGGFDPIHTLHPYFAKFNPKLPRNLIETFTSKGDVVLDPFGGCGTTLVEATLLGRNAVGIDANPLGCFFAKVKTTTIDDNYLDIIESLLQNIENDIAKFYGEQALFSEEKKIISYHLPEFYNRDFWFTKDALNELAIIKAHILLLKNKDLKDFALLAFSRIIVYSSNQQTESRYKRVDKSRRPKDILNQYKKTLLSMKVIMKNYARSRENVDVKIYYKDSRYINFIEPESIDLIVTSPPYLNSWDYGLYHRFRFFWLDMDIKGYEEKEIGKHLRTIEGRSNKDEVERYRYDMGLCLEGFSKVLKFGSYCCIVNANSIVQKKFIDTNKILIEEGKKHKLKIVEIINRKVYGPHYGMHASLNAKKISVESESFMEEDGTTGKQEQILIFKKG